MQKQFPARVSHCTAFTNWKCRHDFSVLCSVCRRSHPTHLQNENGLLHDCMRQLPRHHSPYTAPYNTSILSIDRGMHDRLQSNKAVSVVVVDAVVGACLWPVCSKYKEQRFSTVVRSENYIRMRTAFSASSVFSQIARPHCIHCSAVHNLQL